MKKLIVACLCLLSLNVFAYSDIVYSPKVIDGDTIDTGIIVVPGLSALRLRIFAIDTPEIKGKCQKEKDLAKEAKSFLEHTLYRKDVRLIAYKWDKYAPRFDGDILVDGVSMAEEMIRRGYAVPYTGQGIKKDWCK